MLINIQADRESTASGVEVAQMRFDTTKQAKLFHMLSSSLYSDKPASIIRELCSNCHDSHVMAGKTHIPFELKGPTFENPFLVVKDYGVGLSADEAVNTILCYLGSNKDTSNDFIGGWGIGSKSPFAYAKNYNVVVVKNGMRAEFACWKDEHGLPSQALIDHSPTDLPNGVEIIVPVEPEDVWKFTDAIHSYMQWTNYNVVTTSGTDRVERRQAVETVKRGDDYTIELFDNGSGEFRLVYGGQSYDMEACVDNRYDSASTWQQLREAASKSYDIAIVVHRPNSIDFNMNREELEQTEKTRAFINTIIDYLGPEGMRHAKAYADELEAWKMDVKQRRDAGEEVVISLHDVSETIERALSRGDNADRFFGKAFRLFEHKFRYDLRGTTHHVTGYSSVTRIHSLQLVIAQLHTQIEFVYGRLMTLNHSQRRDCIRGARASQVIYVKAQDRAEFDKWIAEHPDFKTLDMSVFTVRHFDIPKSAPAARSSRGDLPPRIYDTVNKGYLAYNIAHNYVMVDADDRDNADVAFIKNMGKAGRTFVFTPTPDFKKRQRPFNVYSKEEFVAGNLEAAKKQLKEVAGLYGRRLHKIAEALGKMEDFAHRNSLPDPLQDQVDRLCEHYDGLVTKARVIHAKIGNEAFLTAGKGKAQGIIVKLHGLAREAERVMKVTGLLHISKVEKACRLGDPVAINLVTSLGVDKYFVKKI